MFKQLALQTPRTKFERMIWPEPALFMFTHCDYRALSLRLSLASDWIARLRLLNRHPIVPQITDCKRHILKPRTTRKTGS